MDPCLCPFTITLHYRITVTFCLLDFFSCSTQRRKEFVLFPLPLPVKCGELLFYLSMMYLYRAGNIMFSLPYCSGFLYHAKGSCFTQRNQNLGYYVNLSHFLRGVLILIFLIKFYEITIRITNSRCSYFNVSI